MITEEELEAAKREAEFKKIKRKGKIDGINDYVQYFTGRISGLVGVAFGASEILNPDFIPYNTQHPEWILGGGFSLLAGKTLTNVVINAVKRLSKDDK